MTAEEIAKGLGGGRTGNGWTARCPAHEDRNPSLSIREGREGRVLVKCFAGCDQNRFIDSLRSMGSLPSQGVRISRLNWHFLKRRGAQRSPPCSRLVNDLRLNNNFLT